MLCSERLPMIVAEKYLTDIGYSTFLGDNAWHCSFSNNEPTWWLEEVELPSEVEKPLLEYVINKHTQEECIGFIDGFNKAIELIKGEGLNNPTTN